MALVLTISRFVASGGLNRGTRRVMGVCAGGAMDELGREMERRWEELMTLRASPEMYGSESLDGQVAELERWPGRLQRREETASNARGVRIS